MSEDDPAPLPDLPASQRDLLLTVARCGGTPGASSADLPRMGELAEEMDAMRTNGSSYRRVSKIAMELRERGYLTSTPDPTDGRAKIYRVTEQGMGVLDRLADHHRWESANVGSASLETRIERYLHTVAEHPTKREVGVKDFARELDEDSRTIAPVVSRVIQNGVGVDVEEISPETAGRRWRVEP